MNVNFSKINIVKKTLQISCTQNQFFMAMIKSYRILQKLVFLQITYLENVIGQ